MFGLNFSKSDMSALGQKQTWRQASAMSVLPPKSGHWVAAQDVRFVPIADMTFNFSKRRVLSRVAATSLHLPAGLMVASSSANRDASRGRSGRRALAASWPACRHPAFFLDIKRQ